jgi:signal transduction histidine kinase
VWQGELDARVATSSVADAGIQRVGNTLNLLLDGLSADQARLRTLANKVIEAGDRERASLARELHDSTAQSLAALLLELSVVAAENGDPRLTERIARIRSIVGDDLGLVAALQLLARESRERSDVSVTYAGPPRVEALDPSCASALYRVGQEAVGNSIRHGRATSVSIRLQENSGDLGLEITDDGIGFAPAEVERRRPGMGLFTMRERVSLVGGRLTVHSSSGEGTRIVATVPRSAVTPAPIDAAATAGLGNSWTEREEV